jgi:hypothetical protein
MDRVQPLVYQALQPMKEALETQYKGKFDTFELIPVFEGYPSSGYILEIKAPWTQTADNKFSQIVEVLHKLKKENEYARYIMSIKLLYD